MKTKSQPKSKSKTKKSSTSNSSSSSSSSNESDNQQAAKAAPQKKKASSAKTLSKPEIPTVKTKSKSKPASKPATFDPVSLVPDKPLQPKPAKILVSELKDLCRTFGISGSGNKGELMERLKTHLLDIASQPSPRSILALDIGTTNLGFIHMQSVSRPSCDDLCTSDATKSLESGSSSTSTPPSATSSDPKAAPTPSASATKVLDRISKTRQLVISDWGLITPVLPKAFSPREYAIEISRILDSRLFRGDLDTVLIERQSWRPLGMNRSVPHAILRSTAMEAMMLGMIMERGRASNLRIISVSPKAVSDLFDLAGNLSQTADRPQADKLDTERVGGKTECQGKE
eukprot:jgi/Hompol1/5997/HPOL_000162-RA